VVDLIGDEFPALSGCVDGHGRPVLRIGTVSAGTGAVSAGSASRSQHTERTDVGSPGIEAGWVGLRRGPGDPLRITVAWWRIAWSVGVEGGT
jgi:hypothetical protein